MSYEHFAYLYDELMADAPYDEWVQFVKEKAEKYHVIGKNLLDIACGTGELSVRLAKAGLQVTGVDLSSDMLAVAQAKAEASALDIPFFEQNMTDLEGQGQFALVTIFCDSLNYLSSGEEVQDTFANVFAHLNDDGLFLFDVHSIYKVREIFMNQTFALNEEHLAYIWNSFPGEYPDSVEHELSFFVLDERDGKYRRYDELHFQRTFSIQQYSDWLEEAGYDILEVNSDFKAGEPEEQAERIFFTARKRK